MSERRTRPDVKEIKNAYDYLFSASASLSKLKDAALGGRLFSATEEASAGVAGRSLAWKLFLIPSEPLQASPDVIAAPPMNALRAQRLAFKSLLLEKMRAPDGSYEDGLVIPGTSESPPRTERSSVNLDRNNPLSLHDENPWTEWFAAMELRKTILQDVERTFPDIGYFRDQDVQTQLTNILFVHSITHPDIGYRQGMHELLAPLYYAIDYDSIPAGNTDFGDQAAEEFVSRAWVAADAWALFDVVMRGAGRWYEWRESKTNDEKLTTSSHINLSASVDLSIKPYVAPIVQTCNRIQSTLLKIVDPELWKKLQSSGIEPQIYGIRWLRLLFTREFNMQDAMVLWDGLFACDPTFDLAEWICVAMLIRIRNQLIPSDYSGQLTCLLRYPSHPPQNGPISTPIHSSILLIRQALTLQMSPTSATGVSIIHENRNLLGVPVEVPESPPPPTRRRPRPEGRGQSVSEVNSSSNAVRTHVRQGSSPMGLPEMIARNLLERGESLGINKTVMNAMTELKRNLPDISSSLARLPGSPTSSMYAAYPLVDERPPSERPPWEPKTRFEMERELAEQRILQRRLGDSLGWIVDTLLLDEGDSQDEEKAKGIQNRKREALESLSYVRDILKGTVQPAEIEDDRLIAEEAASKMKAVRRQKEASESSLLLPSQVIAEERTRTAPTPTPPEPSASTLKEPRVVQTVGRRKPSDHFPPASPFGRSAPNVTHSKPPAPIPRQPTTAPQPAIVPAVTINPTATTFAPWNHTRSSFSAGGSPLASLPRLPPKTSTTLRPGVSRPPVSMSSSPSMSDGVVSRDQAPLRNAQQDPLGVLR